MDNERKTKAVKTPIGKVDVVFKTHMTGGEMMDLEGASVDAGVKSVSGKTGDITMNAGEAYKKRLRKLADIMIVSIGESKTIEENWKALRDMHSQDYTFVMREIEVAAAGLGPVEGKE